MWKCATQSLRSTFKKSVLRCSTVLSTCSQGNKEVCPFLKYTPALIQQCNRFFNKYKGTCENFTKEHKDREGPNEKTSFLGGLENYFVDALSWTGAVVLVGYYAVYYDRKKFFHYSDIYENRACPVKIGCCKTLEFLVNNVGVKPYNCVFPEVQAAKTGKDKQQFTTTDSKESKREINFSGIEKAHQKVIGTLSNWLGTQCMQSGQHNEALKYFMRSAEEGYAPGIFNLGICHEKGFGTSQNFNKAAELYQKAADLGHATAMYNLGVFYAQGIGGIQPDMNHARELFKTAANLGQADAVKALSLEKQPAKESPESSLVPECQRNVISTFSQLIFDNFLDQPSSTSFRDFNVCDGEVKTHCDTFEYAEQKEINSTSDHDSGILDISPLNEPCTLLV